MAIFRVSKDKDNPYVIVNKDWINDKKLSAKAKGILLYLLSKPDDWQVYEIDIVNNMADGKDSIKSGIKELIDAGYIHRKEQRNESGQFKGYEYFVFEHRSGKPDIGKPDIGKSDIGKPATTNNELTNNELTNNELTNIIYSEMFFRDNIFLDIYLKEHEKAMGRGHVRVSKEKLEYILDFIETKIENVIDIESWEKVVKEHFKHLPENNNGNVLSFIASIRRHFVDVTNF